MSSIAVVLQTVDSMDTESVFIDALAHNHLDNATRLVYADLLEELGDERCQFLRAEVQLHECLLAIEEDPYFKAPDTLTRNHSAAEVCQAK